MYVHKIKESECGRDYALRLSPLFSILQDSVEEDMFCHDIFTHEAMKKRGNFFVLTQMQADMRYMPKAKETIKIKTWHSGLSRLYPLRKFLIFDENDKEIGYVNSTWAILDINDGRPLRPKKAYSEVPWGEPEFEVLPRIKPAPDAQKCAEIVAKYGDIDVNNHVNNARYIAWVEDVIKKTPRKILVNYVSQVMLGDRIEAYEYGGQVAFFKDDKLVFIAEYEE